REAEGEGVEGRGDPGEEAEADVGEEEHGDERPRDLDGGEEQLGDAAREVPGEGAEVEHDAEREGVEAAGEAADDELVAVGDEEEHDGDELVEPAERAAVGHRHRVEGLPELEAAEHVDEPAGGLDGGEDE